jgi:hypothetical protein
VFALAAQCRIRRSWRERPPFNGGPATGGRFGSTNGRLEIGCRSTKKGDESLSSVQAPGPTSGLAFANASYTRSLRISFKPALTLSFFNTCSDIDMWLS